MRHTILTLLILVAGSAICCRETLARKWTDKTGKFSVEADFVSLADDAVSLKRPDGQVIKIPMEKLSTTDQEVARALAQARNDASAEPNPFVPAKEKSEATTPDTGKAPSPTTGGLAENENLREVVANGSGQTPETALRSAQQAAIEQVVGVLVDAKTITNNDAVIQEKILTASNAYIQRCDELKRWREDGLDYCRVRALVRIRVLREAMEANKIVVRAVRGQDMAVQFETTKKANQDASAMLADSIRDFPNRVLAATAKGDPKAVAEPKSGITRVRIPVEIAVDTKAYTAQLEELQSRLDHLAIKKFTAVCKLLPQDPVSPTNEIEEHNEWDSVFLWVPGQAGLDQLAYPPANRFVPMQWYACFGNMSNYNSRTKINPFRDGPLAARIAAMVSAANRSLDGGIDQVDKLRKEKQQELVAVVLVGAPNRSGSMGVSTYALPEGVISPPASLYHDATVLLTIKLLDAAGAVVETADVKIDATSGRYARFLLSAGFVEGFRFKQDKDHPLTLGIWPGLRLGHRHQYSADEVSAVLERSAIALAQSYMGNVYMDVAVDSLAKVRKVGVSLHWEPMIPKR